tara:strand:+ start:12 stop:695 length:684 start_codon:yes stop_codon:yes gene_type:complete
MQPVAKLQTTIVEQSTPSADTSPSLAYENASLMQLTVQCINAAYEAKLHPENTHYVTKLESTLDQWQHGVKSLELKQLIRNALYKTLVGWLFLQLNYRNKHVVKRLPHCNAAEYLKHVEVFSKMLMSLPVPEDCVRCLHLVLQQPIPYINHVDSRRLSKIKHRVAQLYRKPNNKTGYKDVVASLFYHPQPSVFGFESMRLGLVFSAGFITCLLAVSVARLYLGTCIL